jgi:hypothetical protein
MAGLLKKRIAARISVPSLGACPSHAILLRQTICRHLRRSRLASAGISFSSQRKITRTGS